LTTRLPSWWPAQLTMPDIPPTTTLVSLRRRLAISIAIATGCMLLSVAILVVALTRVAGATSAQVDRLDPAGAATLDLATALLDQQTAIRGYALTADRALLAPYETGVAAQAEAADRLRALLRDEPAVLRDLDDLDGLAQGWRTDFAEPVISQVNAAGAGSVPPATFAESGRRFVEVRTTLELIERDLADAREQSRADLTSANALLIALFLVGSALLAIGLVVVWALLRRWVTDPLDRLGAEVRRVVGGDLEHRIDVSGPSEITALAADVESMRRGVVLELGIAVQAREELRTATTMLEDQAEELRRSNRDLEQFAYVASHDLQEPLRKVISFCQLLQKRYAGKLDERGDQYVDFAVDGAKRMQRLINDLLAFSRVGRTTGDFVDVPLDEALAEALSRLSTPIEEAQAEVTADPLPVVLGDPTLLTQVFQNLVGNAVKFRSEAPPRIHIGVERGDEFWQFTCTDNGIGIAPEYAEKIFVIFQRLHSRDEYGGTGIGLALVKKIIEFHGGRIWLAAPAATSGTTLCFTLPLTVAPPPVSAAPAAAVERTSFVDA
jgi:signal transduction histidine kinase